MTNDKSESQFDLSAFSPKEAPPSTKAPSQSRSYGKKDPSAFTFYKLTTAGAEPPKGERPNYRIKKFDHDLNLLSDYVLNFLPTANGGYYDCNCPASKFDCRHKSIMKKIISAGQVDSTKFYCFETELFKEAEDI